MEGRAIRGHRFDTSRSSTVINPISITDFNHKFQKSTLIKMLEEQKEEMNDGNVKLALENKSLKERNNQLAEKVAQLERENPTKPERMDKLESSEKEADKPVNGKPRPKKRTFEKTDDNDGESENHTDAENVEEVTFHISPRPSTRVIKRLQRPPRRPMITWSPCPERFTFLNYCYIGQVVRFVKLPKFYFCELSLKTP